MLSLAWLILPTLICKSLFCLRCKAFHHNFCELLHLFFKSEQISGESLLGNLFQFANEKTGNKDVDEGESQTIPLEDLRNICLEYWLSHSGQNLVDS